MIKSRSIARILQKHVQVDQISLKMLGCIIYKVIVLCVTSTHR